jgi:hypothetical protein
MNGHALQLLGVLLMLLVSAIARSRARRRDLDRLH